MKSPTHPFRSERARAEYHALYVEWAKKWPVASETRLIETPTGQTFIRMSGRMTDLPLTPDGETTLSGSVIDRASLHGLLARIRDLNLTLISVIRIKEVR